MPVHLGTHMYVHITNNLSLSHFSILEPLSPCSEKSEGFQIECHLSQQTPFRTQICYQFEALLKLSHPSNLESPRIHALKNPDDRLQIECYIC